MSDGKSGLFHRAIWLGAFGLTACAALNASTGAYSPVSLEATDPGSLLLIGAGVTIFSLVARKRSKH